jgi:hypothetical protein
MKEGHRVWLVNPPERYVDLLGELPEGARIVRRPTGALDIIQVFLDNRQEMEERLPEVKEHMGPRTILWATYHKGTSPVPTDINRDIIWSYARTIGMDAVAQVAVDDDWSAIRLKLVPAV